MGRYTNVMLPSVAEFRNTVGAMEVASSAPLKQPVANRPRATFAQQMPFGSLRKRNVPSAASAEVDSGYVQPKRGPSRAAVNKQLRRIYAERADPRTVAVAKRTAHAMNIAAFVCIGAVLLLAIWGIGVALMSMPMPSCANARGPLKRRLCQWFT